MESITVLIIALLIILQIFKTPPEQVWLADKDLAAKIKFDYGAFVYAFSSRYNIKPDIIFSIIAVESSGQSDVVGGIGEIGLMQISEVARIDLQESLGLSFTKDQLFNPYSNINAGTAFFALTLRRCGHNIETTIRAYNVGATGAQENSTAGRGYLNKVQYWRKFFSA